MTEKPSLRQSLHDYFDRRKKLRRYRQWTGQDQERLGFYRQFVKPGDLVFDVGANVGNRTKIFARLQARVVAFEPQDACAEVLERATAGDAHITVVRQALGSHAGQAQMLVCGADTIASLSAPWTQAVKDSGRFANCEWRGAQTVAVATLDQAISTYGLPAFIKIDVEGFEAEVLAGLSHPVPGLSIEFSAEVLPTTCQCIDRLNAQAQATFQVAWEENLAFALPAWVTADEIKRVLADAAARNKLAWGDVYVRTGVA